MEELKRWDRDHNFRTWAFQGAEPYFVEDAYGAWFTDVHGKRILDLSSQLMCSNLGHKNQRVVAAIVSQLNKVEYVAPGFATRARAELAHVLTTIAPRNLARVFFSTSGTEANEAALKIARVFTGKLKFISRYRSYHGSTMGSISLTGDPRRLPAEPGVPGMIKAPDPYCYRCPFELTHPACKLRCVEYIDEMLYLEGDTIAGIVVEPIVGSNGILVPPDGYMPRLKQIAEAHKALLIVDEVMTGFGRTGAWFAVQHWGVEPDILTMAKGLTGAYFPLGATMVSREISEFFHGHIFSHGHTYTGHPVGCAAALAAISVYRDEGLIEHARQMGAYLQVALRDLAARHRSVGDVRGIGLFWGLEIVRDRATKEPFTKPGGQLSRTDTVPQKVCREALKLGVYVVGMANTLIIAPPLIVTKDELDYGISVLDRALEVADAETS